MTIRRGDVVTVVMQGDLGKPRPAVVVQSDYLITPTLIVCPLTSDPVDLPVYRMRIEPSATNGLRVRSYAMVEKLSTIGRWKVGSVIGRLTDDELAELRKRMAEMLGLFDA